MWPTGSPVGQRQAGCTTAKQGQIMARLVAVCREDEEDFKFLARQIPVFIDDSLEVGELLHMVTKKMPLKIIGG